MKDGKNFECFFVFLSSVAKWGVGNYLLFSSSNDVHLLNVNIRVTTDVTVYRSSTPAVDPGVQQ